MRAIPESYAAKHGGALHSALTEGASRHRYYALTPWGRRMAEAEAERLDAVLQVARSRRLLPG